MQETPYYLYKMTNKINGKLYIGISKRPEQRKKDHFNYRNRNTAVNILYQAIDKYGEENFDFEIICIGNKEYILDLEKKAIKLYRTREKEFGYNIKPGGEEGRGYSITNSKSDNPVFVSGWWFPNRRTACKSLNITVSVYKNRQRDGTLGDIIRYKTLSKYQKEGCYVGDFWFPDIDTASEKLNMKVSTIRGRLVNKRTSAVLKKKRDQDGPNNHMYGIAQKDHPSSIAVAIDGVRYDSIKQATESTGFSKYVINQRIKENHPNFSYG